MFFRMRSFWVGIIGLSVLVCCQGQMYGSNNSMRKKYPNGPEEAWTMRPVVPGTSSIANPPQATNGVRINNSDGNDSQEVFDGSNQVQIRNGPSQSPANPAQGVQQRPIHFLPELTPIYGNDGVQSGLLPQRPLTTQYGVNQWPFLGFGSTRPQISTNYGQRPVITTRFNSEQIPSTPYDNSYNSWMFRSDYDGRIYYVPYFFNTRNDQIESNLIAGSLPVYYPYH